MKVVIMAAGKSTRTQPLTVDTPKALLPLFNKPLLQHTLDAVKDFALEIIIIVGFEKNQIEDFVLDLDHYPPITLVEQTEQKGTGHAVLCVKEHVGEDAFMLLNGDDVYSKNDLLALKDLSFGALVKEVDSSDVSKFGIFTCDDAGKVIKFEEKPKESESRLANIGAYVLPSLIFTELEQVGLSSRGEIEINPAILALAQKGSMSLIPITGHWIPIGYPWDLLTAHELLMKEYTHFNQGEISPNTTITGEVTLGAGSVIRAGVVIDGPVVIGHNTTIGPNSYLRPGTVIGNHCHVGQSSELKNTIVMDGSKIPHLSYVGDSIIGKNCNLGAGTVVANLRHDGAHVKSMVNGTLIDTGRRKFGTVLGNGVKTGANTLINPGRKIFPGVHTLPGQIVKEDLEK